jgi:hypothetical protein
MRTDRPFNVAHPLGVAVRRNHVNSTMHQALVSPSTAPFGKLADLSTTGRREGDDPSVAAPSRMKICSALRTS